MSRFGGDSHHWGRGSVTVGTPKPVFFYLCIIMSVSGNTIDLGRLRIKKEAKVRECGAGQQANDANSMCDTCPGSTVSSGDGNCAPCRAGTGVPNAAKTACVLMCADGTSITSEQTCEETCAANFQDYDADTKTCMPCTGNDYFNNGTCEACPSGSEPSSNRSTCECSAGHALQEGTCQRCPDSMGVNDAGTGCETCASNLFSKDDGICRSCPSGQAPDDAQTGCIRQDTCQNGTTVRPTLGEVCEETCSGRLTDYNPDTKSCVACGSDEFFNPESTNCEACPTSETNLRSAIQSCFAPLPFYPETTADVYNDDLCKSQGWSVLYDIDSAMRVAELCEVPVVIASNAAITTVAPLL